MTFSKRKHLVRSRYERLVLSDNLVGIVPELPRRSQRSLFPITLWLLGLFLVGAFLTGCDRKPPTPAEIEAVKLDKCVDDCRQKYLDSVVVKFSKSRIDDPSGLASCLNECGVGGCE